MHSYLRRLVGYIKGIVIIRVNCESGFFILLFRVNIGQLEKFFSSQFFKKIESSKKLYRETRFNLLLPAYDFTSDSSVAEALKSEEILVQGVIDLLFIDSEGKTVLCDYKTDYIPKEIIGNELEIARFLFDRHGEQLSYYAKAVQKLLSHGRLS